MKDDNKRSTPGWANLYYDGAEESEPTPEEIDLLLNQLAKIISDEYLRRYHDIEPRPFKDDFFNNN